MAANNYDNTAIALQSCLDDAGVRNIIKSDDAWSESTAQFQKRLKPDPACIAFPKNRDQVAHCLKCAREASVKATALGPAHSFNGLGFGSPGNLVISMAAFDSISYDETTTLLTFGGGTHIGPVAKYLWDTAGRHFPHVRGAHVGVTGSSIGCGFGSTSRFLGTPMDNIISIEFMLYDGTIVTATEGSDLLWTAKGAASSYGIILSMTTKTFKPKFDKAIKFTLSIGDIDALTAAKAFIAVQDYGTSSLCPDEFVIRWSLVDWTSKGYFYGDPSTFDEVITPLLNKLERISGQTSLEKEELDFWSMEVEISGEGMNRPDGGDLDARSFYVQSLVTTTDHPLTAEQARILFDSTTLAFNRTDLTKMGYIDLWGGISRDVSDEDTGHPHGKNLWLIRWDANAVDDDDEFPADGTSYMKSLFLPFERALVASGVPLRGFVNYADTELSKEEQASRLYGKNYDRLKKIKAEVDPEGLFINNPQSIPLPKTPGSLRVQGQGA
ncbi:hypothetical protein FSARC_10227 [Fusarium sarcochroum]|uniref:FAD-binding PCMH-type domain-containing protein n=1 Tax=Fusarium sarcochroum TaxID=1208366 RepID=A0A8H4X4M4_9HYPO|nr:hypothetical protein FSARC_10227 [Fusarium sarcochroum]